MSKISAKSSERVTDTGIETTTYWRVDLDGATLADVLAAVEYLESRGVPMNTPMNWRRKYFNVHSRTVETPLKKLPKAFA